MTMIQDYEIESIISETNKAIIYRVQKEGKRYIIKSLRPTDSHEKLNIRRLKQEYETLKIMDFSTIVKAVSFESNENLSFIVMEDIGGESLNIILKKRKFSIKEFYTIALQVVEGLNYIHSLNYIHRDINSNNIVVNLETGRVNIIDFEIAISQRKGIPILQKRNEMEGTLDYVSPEQTGRVNSALDNRSDLYSLGVTFYEMLTGILPFHGIDPLEIMHCHIAQREILLYERDNSIPMPVSNIVKKLMNKDPHDRYQSALGLMYDLQRCFEMYTNNEYSEMFITGSRDFSDGLHIPQKLYGRELEIRILMDAFERVCKGGSECIFISGYSGSGKTSLVNELYRPIIEKKGIFIRGKFDQLQRNIPYHAWIQSFKTLVELLLSERKSKIEEWKKIILEAVDDNGKLLADMVPEFEFIIGKQPELRKCDAIEAQNRFYKVLKKFIGAIASKETPLLIFMDDLQWTDMASLNLLKALMNDTDIKYVLWIGAYRDNEVSIQHPLSVFIKGMKEEGILFSECKVDSLKKSDVDKLLADTFNQPLQQNANIAELIYSKTQGNAFFLKQFLIELYECNMLHFKVSEKHGKYFGEWTWDLEKINQLNITDNVVDLIKSKIHRLDWQVQVVLKMAACIGNDFDIDTLVIITEQLKENILNFIKTAESEGFIIYVSESRYKFVHDRVQQAAYAWTHDESDKELHMKIGRLLFENTPKEKLKERIFDIVNQWNHGISLITEDETNLKLAKLNYIAGRQALESLAHKTAASYLYTAMQLSNSDSWHNSYDFTFSLHIDAADAALFSGDLDKCSLITDTIIENATNVYQKMQGYRIKMQMMAYMGKLRESIPIGLESLRILGIDIPNDANDEQIRNEYKQIVEIISSRSFDELLDLPDMTDSIILAAMPTLKIMVSTGYMSGSPIFPLLAMRGVLLTLQYGHTYDSLTCWAVFDVIVTARMGNYDFGHEIYDFIFKLMERFGKRDARSLIFLYGIITHTKEHLSVSRKGFMQITTMGLENSELEFVFQGAIQGSAMAYFMGSSLSELHDEMEVSSDILRKNKHTAQLSRQIILLQAVKNLLSDEKQCDFRGPAFDEEKMIPFLAQTGDLAALYLACSLKMMICYLHEEYEKAMECIAIIEKYDAKMVGQVYEILVNFYGSLSRLSLCEGKTASERQTLVEIVEKNQEKLKKLAHYAPMNYLHKFLLVEAEKNRVLGNMADAMKLYDQAIEEATVNRFINDEALANELASRFYAENGRKFISKSYLKEAYVCYTEWGAVSKNSEMKKKYPELFYNAPSKTSISKRDSSTIEHTIMDMDTIIKASQAISEEIEIDKLLSKLMDFVGENAGAQKIYFITKKGEQNVIQAKSLFEENNIAVIGEKTITTDILPERIINYVENSRESIVLNNAAKSQKFGDDPYIAYNRVKSLMCLPVVNKGEIIGILYMENNLIEGVFSNEHVNILKIIVSQLAISWENAKLYSNLEDLVKERTSELNEEINERKKAQRLLEEAATHDYLTGLPNRKLFMETLEHAVKLSLRNKTILSIMFIDLDGFKAINDNLGHDNGDITLKIVSERLRDSVRACDTVCRLGGDEFTIIIENIVDLSTIDWICQRIIQSVSEKMYLGENEAYVTASIGISVFPTDSCQIDDLVKKADDAMFSAKRTGKNKYIYWSK